MTYQLLFFNASVQADIQDWPTQVFASFVRIAEQMEVSGPNLGLPYTKARRMRMNLGFHHLKPRSNLRRLTQHDARRAIFLVAHGDRSLHC